MQTMVPLYGFGGVPYSAVRKAAPRNLLDNSDFRNPVNQRGLTSYSNEQYTIDRWKWTYAATTRKTTVNSGSITIQNDSASNGYFGQILEKPANNVPHTVAVKVGGQIYTGIISWGGSSSGVQLVDNCSIYGDDTRDRIFFLIPSGKTLSNIEWISLYEGSYTAETLPEYQPKGYGAELAECQRYFLQITKNGLASNINYLPAHAITTSIAVTLIPVTMRVNPTVTINKCYLRKGITDIAIDSVNSAYARGFGMEVTFNLSGLTQGETYILRLSSGTMQLSADL